MEIRCKNENEIRQFVPPSINFSAVNIEEFIDWKNAIEPPLTKNKIVKLNDLWKLIPSHSQAVERAVKLYTASPLAVVARNGFIRNTIESKQIFAKFIP